MKRKNYKIKNKSLLRERLNRVVTIKNNTMISKNLKNLKNNKNTVANNFRPLKNFKSLIKLFLILLLVSVIGSLATVFVYYKSNIVHYQEIPMIVKVQKGASSFNTSTESLNFARLSPGNGATKIIMLSSQNLTKVHFEPVGTIAKFISLSENNFILLPEENKIIEVYLDIPKDADEGVYNGTLKIYFYKQK
ncbi:MAG: hypothetical protein KatS3mg002_1509 [Candidatus Woesearchaeota archaeon]|nr:MAG: hypothetical protein KatS3mg002_1509 [Candidatus Woesearchaeota archaeon]